MSKMHRTERLSFRLTCQDRALLEVAAAALGLSLSAFVRRVLDDATTDALRLFGRAP